jgi:hypothetical protein
MSIYLYPVHCRRGCKAVYNKYYNGMLGKYNEIENWSMTKEECCYGKQESSHIFWASHSQQPTGGI